MIFPGDRPPPVHGKLVSCSLFTVPSLANVWPSDSPSRPTVRLEVVSDISFVASKNQERRQLHLDPQNTNLFRIMESRSMDEEESRTNEEKSLLAVQIDNVAFSLRDPAYILIPPGMYHFLAPKRIFARGLVGYICL